MRSLAAEFVRRFFRGLFRERFANFARPLLRGATRIAQALSLECAHRRQSIGRLRDRLTGRAIVNATVEVQLNAPGDNVTVNGRKVRLT